MTGLLYNLAPSRHFLLLRFGVVRKNETDAGGETCSGAKSAAYDGSEASIRNLDFFIEHISRGSSNPAHQPFSPKIKISDAWVHAYEMESM